MFFFFNDTATTEIYTLSLHDALPICSVLRSEWVAEGPDVLAYWIEADTFMRHMVRILVGTMLSVAGGRMRVEDFERRSEEHTSELQSRQYLVCRLLLEKKKITPYIPS